MVRLRNQPESTNLIDRTMQTEFESLLRYMLDPRRQERKTKRILRKTGPGNYPGGYEQYLNDMLVRQIMMAPIGERAMDRNSGGIYIPDYGN